GTNLSRREARARSALLRVQDCRVALDLTRGDAVFGSTTEIDFTAAQSETETFIDLVAPSVHEVILNGAPLDPATAYRDGRIHLTGLQDHNTVKIVADCAYSNT